MREKVSIIIPTLNGSNFIGELIRRLIIQKYSISEIIVIDSASSDDTVSIAEQCGARVINITRSQFDHGGTRNYASNYATGDILVFMTQDALPEDEDTISRLVEPFKDSDVLVSYARQIPKPNASITDCFLRLYNYPPSSRIKSNKDIPQIGIKTFQNSNVCAAYRYRKFVELGRFTEPVVSNEDMLFAAKVILKGYKVAYTAEARVYHSHEYTFKEIFKRYFDIGASLEKEPLIMKVGRTESKGLDFLNQQIKYTISKKMYTKLPWILCEAGFKYLGYKLGEKHQLIPYRIKKHLGLNKNYWSHRSNQSK